jgi:uncharacterized repeat protein (TIGR01451 family)
MRASRTPLLVAVALAGGLLVAQEPGPLPPLDAKRMPRRMTDPDADDEVRPAQHVVPADLPGEVFTGPVIVPAAYAEAAGDLPTPAVTLNIEGTDVSATGAAVVYKLRVTNNSRAKAHNVVLRVTPPKDAEPVGANPPADEKGAEPRWTWKTLEPGQTRTVEVQYTPKAGAEKVEVRARVQFDYGRGMITHVSAPALSVKKTGPVDGVVVGDMLTYRITVTNTGKVPIRNVEVSEFLGKGLVYEEREIARGRLDGWLTSSVDAKTGQRTWTIPAIPPGRSETLEYRAKAREAGRFPSTVLVKAAGVTDKAETETEVLTAQLQLQAEGPADGKGMVDQPARYKAVVENRGSADLRNVVVRCQFPSDLRPRAATNGGERFRDSVQWVFKELKKGESKELNVALTAASPGTRTVRFSARAEKGGEQKAQVTTEFAGLPSLDWDVDAPGVGTVGKPLTYRVTVANRGTATGRARLQVDLPPSLDRKSTVPAAGEGTGQNAKEVRFQEYDFPAGKKTTFTVVVEPRTAGEAKTIFTLYEQGRHEKQESKVTNVTGSDGRSPAGPPPARGVDRTKVGASPRP